MVVSGGKTPIGLFKKLSNKNIDWSRVNITLTDERWVSLENKQSNERMIRNYLLKNKASSANFIGLKSDKNLLSMIQLIT